MTAQSVKMTAKEADAIIDEAIAAADAAAVTSSEDMYCGFAWVKIFPARGPIVTALKKRGMGDKSYAGGYDIWSSMVTGSDRVRMSQSMTLKENVCSAYAKVLQSYGITAYMGSRGD